MKKKIISFGIISILLLAGLTSLSALGMKVEKSENPSDITSTDEGGNICICVYIRYNPLRNGPLYNIPVDDATVTGKSLEDGTVYELEWHTDILWAGYYLLDAPAGNYLFEAKRGFRSGSVEHSIKDGGMTSAEINLTFTKNAKVHDELPVLSILRLILSRLPVFK